MVRRRSGIVRQAMRSSRLAALEEKLGGDCGRMPATWLMWEGYL